MNVAEVQAKSRKSVKWSFYGEIFAKVATPLSTMVLARILAPNIFGISTAVTLVVSFCEAITETGFSKFIIQKDFESEENYKKYLFVSLISSIFFSFLLCAVIFLFSNQISSFVGNDGYGIFLSIACLQIPIAAFNAILFSDLKRNFKFNLIFVVRIISCLIPFAVTIPLALLGFGVWSLVIGTIFIQVAQTPLLIWFAKQNLKPFFSISYFKKLFKGSYIMILESIVIWMCSWTTTFIATQFFDSTTVGIVKVSESTVNSIFTLFSAGFVSVLFPTLSRLKNSNNEYKEEFYSLQSSTYVMMIPVSVGCYFYSDVITQVFLGSSWHAASKVIGIMALSRFLMICVNNFASEVFRTKGHFVFSIIYQIIMLVIDVGLKFTLGKISFDYYIATIPIKNIAITLIALLILKFKYGFSLAKQIKSFAPSLLCSFIMIPLILLNKSNNSTFIQNIGQIIVCAASYFAIGFLAYPSLFKASANYLGFKMKQQ